jgi:hypothetical protein
MTEGAGTTTCRLKPGEYVRLAETGNGECWRTIQQVASPDTASERTVRKRCQRGPNGEPSEYVVHRQGTGSKARAEILCDRDGRPIPYCTVEARGANPAAAHVRVVLGELSAFASSVPPQPDVAARALKDGEPIPVVRERVRAAGESRKGLLLGLCIAAGMILTAIILAIAYLVRHGRLAVQAVWFAKEAETGPAQPSDLKALPVVLAADSSGAFSGPESDGMKPPVS